MGQVWKARQLSLDRLVAIKLLPPRLSHDPESIKQIIHEARTAARLKHPGIVHVYDVIEQDGQGCLVMEFVDGYNVGQWISRKKILSYKDALLVVESVAVALKYAWREAGLIHCDIKPENIMIDHDGTIKVSDLGLSLTRDSQGASQVTDEVVGTPGYIAPEQVQGAGQLDCRTDIYSLGCCLYQMVTGVRPFHNLADPEAMEAQVTSQIVDPRDIVPEVPASVCGLIEWMLIKDRAHRLSDWDVVLKELHKVQKSILFTRAPAPAGASTMRRRPQVPAPVVEAPKCDKQPASSSFRIATILVVGAFIVAIQVVGMWWFSRKAERPAAIPVPTLTVSVATNLPVAPVQTAVVPNPVNRGRDIARAVQQIKQVVAEYTLDEKFADGIEWLEAYNGECADETLGLRQDMIATLKDRIAERAVPTPEVTDEPDPAELEWTNQLYAITSCVLSGKYAVAHQMVEDALKDERLNKHKPELISVDRVLGDVASLTDKLLKTYEADIGKEMTIQLVRGPFKGKLLAVRDRKLVLKTADDSAQIDLRLEEISLAERQARLIALDLPEGNLMRGVAAYSAGKDEEAEAFLIQTASKLGPLLIERHKADLAAAKQAATLASEQDAEEESMRGDPAFQAFAKLLKRAGIDLAQCDLAKMKNAIESAPLNPEVAMHADRSLDAFLETHGNSDFAEKHADLVLAFQSACGRAMRQK